MTYPDSVLIYLHTRHGADAMEKTFSILAKTVSLLNLIVAVCRGEGVETAVVSFNNCWN